MRLKFYWWSLALLIGVTVKGQLCYRLRLGSLDLGRWLLLLLLVILWQVGERRLLHLWWLSLFRLLLLLLLLLHLLSLSILVT